VRIHPPVRAYITRRLTEGKTSREAIRALKRYIARRIYRILTTSMITQPITGAAPLRCV
jgi:transposase